MLPENILSGKVRDEYRRNADYRALFPFSKELEELILLPRQYDGFLPIAHRFQNAVCSDSVFMVGAFETQILHTKWLFYVLHREETKTILTKEENEFVEMDITRTTLLEKGMIGIMMSKRALMIRLKYMERRCQSI